MSILRGVIKSFLVAFTLCMCFVVLIPYDLLGKKTSLGKAAAKRRMAMFVSYFAGLRVRYEGRPVDGPAMMVANHCSYVDVMQVLWVTGHVCFTPKSEVRSWPFIGGLLKCYDVVFIDRSRSKSKENSEQLQRMLEAGFVVCVFPEATTSNGRFMLPFRSSLFSIAEGWSGPNPMPVQPVSIVYESVDGKPMNDAVWPDVAWYGDDTFFGHLWRLLKHKTVCSRIIFHEPLFLGEGETRKQLTARAEAIVRVPNPHLSDKPALPKAGK